MYERALSLLTAVGLLCLFAGCSSSPSTTADVQVDGSGEASGELDVTGGDDGDSILADLAEDTERELAGDETTDESSDTAMDVPVDGVQSDISFVPPREDWSSCAHVDYIGGMTLAKKAAYYDWIVPALHQVSPDTAGHEAYSRVFSIHCDGPIPATIVPLDQLPFCTHQLSENNGLWTSLYVASQAYRWAVTKDPAVLQQLRRTLNGTYQQLLITGKPGLYARDFRDPALPQQFCVEDEEPYASATNDNDRYARYVPPTAYMVGNSFVRIHEDGCFMTWDTALNGGNGGWVKDAQHCTDPRFAGFCWQRNASKDEYAGHMFAAGIVARIVDDPDVRSIAVDILGKVGHHLVDHDFWINDYDGRNTRYGSANALALDESPGSNAIMSLAWIKEAAVATGDEVLAAVYNDCLLQLSGELDCIDQPFEIPKDYREYLDEMGLAMGCNSNYDTISIAVLNYYSLIWYEDDPHRRTEYRSRFRENTKGPDSAGRDLWAEGDPFKNFILVSTMEAGQYDQGEVIRLVEEAVCVLKRFNTDNIRRARDCRGYEEWCRSPRHGSLAEFPIPVEERCSSVFEWWGDPNEREVCGEDLATAPPPAGFLLPYWMGRYYGFIGADQ
jgi:hypothetical protein